MDHAPSADPPVAELIAACRSLAEEGFGARLLGIYLIGSLAHGGFAPAASDVGVALILADPLTERDAEQISALAAYCAAAHPRYGRRLSLFWTSPAAFAGTDDVQVAGRFPAIDRLDLMLNGLPVGEADLRRELAPPTRQAILENCREDVLRFIRDPSRYGFLTSGAAYDFADHRALARLCLFPARFLHTAATGTVASNDVAAREILRNPREPDAAIVTLGLILRHDPQYTLAEEECALLRDTLPHYYRRFLYDFNRLLDRPAPPEEATIPLLLAALDQAGT